MMSFVGNDGYGRTKKSVNAYRNRLGFYLRFCAEKRITDLRLGDYDHRPSGILGTLGTFALSLDTTVPAKKIMPKLGCKKKKVKAHTDREQQSLRALVHTGRRVAIQIFPVVNRTGTVKW